MADSGGSKIAWGWDDTNKVNVKVAVDTSGKVKIKKG